MMTSLPAKMATTRDLKNKRQINPEETIYLFMLYLGLLLELKCEQCVFWPQMSHVTDKHFHQCLCLVACKNIQITSAINFIKK